jgi:hypothetical protein
VADATSFPENFDLLHQHEEAIRGQTKEAIAASDTLRRHFAVVEASITLVQHFLATTLTMARMNSRSICSASVCSTARLARFKA